MLGIETETKYNINLPAWLRLLTIDLCTDQANHAPLQLHLQVQPPKSSHPQPINYKWYQTKGKTKL